MSNFKTIELENIRLAYEQSDAGNFPLLLFHGFGQDHKIYDSITLELSKKYTLYSFDLFFHGDSEWNRKEQSLEKKIWKEIITQFLCKENIINFSVLGFSMGGKFALATLELFPDRTREIFLLAPDGIKTSFWYSLATYPVALRRFFKSMIGKHHRFIAIVRIARALGLIDKGIQRFVGFQMNTEEKRRRVYLSWVVFRHLKFDLDKIANLINRYHIQLILVIGKHDRIITAENMRPFLKKINTIQFEIVDAGHNDLIIKSVNVLINAKSDTYRD